MSQMLAVLLSTDPYTEPVVLEVDRVIATVVPIRIRIPIETPDGPHQEVWQLADCLHPTLATYCLIGIETDE